MTASVETRHERPTPAKLVVQSVAVLVFGIPALLLSLALFGWVLGLIYQAVTGQPVPDI